MAANDGIRRGDSARTGDPEARPTAGVDRAGSGVRAGDGGPAGQSTADPSAGEIVPDVEYPGMDDTEGVGETAAGTSYLEELTIVSEDDPNLGLTAHGDVPAEDWAADVGESRNPDRGVSTDNMADDRSTLAPDK